MAHSTTVTADFTSFGSKGLPTVTMAQEEIKKTKPKSYNFQGENYVCAELLSQSQCLDQVIIASV